jgi:RNA polymerase sigma factor (sigma-70 family)
MASDSDGSALHWQMISLIPALRAFAKKLCRADADAEDLVQDTLLRAFANIDRFKPGSYLKGWLFTIMRNTFCTRFAKERRFRRSASPNVLEMLPASDNQEWNVRAAEINRAFLQLSANHREIISLIAVSGESYESAAEKSGCPVGTIKSRLSRARESLNGLLKEDGRDFC